MSSYIMFSQLLIYTAFRKLIMLDGVSKGPAEILGLEQHKVKASKYLG